jgi:hypothetical protein
MISNKDTSIKRKLLHSRRFRMMVVGMPLALSLILIYKYLPQDQAMVVQLVIYSVAIMFLLYNFRKSDEANIIITEQSEEISRQKKQIEEQKILVDKAYEELHEKNKEVLDSIRYALRIQRSLLPNENYISRQLDKLNKK